MSAAGGETIRVAAVHLGGVRDLAAGRDGLELRFSDAGLHIFDVRARGLVGQLTWSEISSLKLSPQRRSPRRLWRRSPPRVEVITDAGLARFELPGLTDEQVQQHLSPLLARGR